MLYGIVELIGAPKGGPWAPRGPGVPLIVDSDNTVELQAIASLAIGLIFCGSCEQDAAHGISPSGPVGLRATSGSDVLVKLSLVGTVIGN